MSSGVSPAVAASAILLTGLITLGRWIFVNDSAANVLINRTLSWAVLSLTIYQVGAGTEFGALTGRLYLGCGVLLVADLYGLARLFDGADTTTVWQRQRRYDALAVVGAAVVIALGRPATTAGFSWQLLLVWAVFNIPTALAAAHTVRACLRDLLRNSGSLLERLPFAGLLLAALIWGYYAIASGVVLLRSGPLISPAEHWTVPSCLTFVAVTALTGVPLLLTVRARLGWDRTGREIRKLRPLWRDLTEAVPAVVLRPQPDGLLDPASRRYRMVVEIRDALVYLQQQTAAGEPHAEPLDAYALRIARAAHGSPGPAGATTGSPAGSPREFGPGDLAAELDHLLELAAVWPRARARALRNRP